MAQTSTGQPDPTASAVIVDGVSLRRWFALYAILLAGAAVWLAMILRSGPLEPMGTWGEFKLAIHHVSPAAKLLVLGIYLSLCCTFLPLNTSWIVAAVATRQLAVGDSLAETVLLIAAVGAAASTIGNLHDYHLFTWLLRSRRIAAMRNTRTYHLARQWFLRSPFFLLVLFNVLPIPVDVVRVIATTHRYPRRAFALANFIGRFIRYGAIACLIYVWALSFETAVGAMLILAAAMTIIRIAPAILRKIAAAAPAAASPREQETS